MSATDPIDVLFVVSPQSLLLDIAGPAEAFRLANLHCERQGAAPSFRLRFAGPDATSSTSTGLVVAQLEPLPHKLERPTWVVLAGQPSAQANDVTPAITTITQWLSRTLHKALETSGTPHRLVTICSGALLAARAGLLGHRQSTTHHDMIDLLRQLSNDTQVVDNRVFVIDGPVATSAGVTAGIDLALELIANECGEAIAAATAKDMVVYLRRSAQDPGLSPFLLHRRHTHSAVHKVQDAISAHPQRQWDMASLARVGHVTDRHLLRLFVNHAGVSPMHYLETIRLERARQSLAHGATVAQAAEAAGFGSSLNLRRAWNRQWGGSPRDAQCTPQREIVDGMIRRSDNRPNAR